MILWLASYCGSQKAKRIYSLWDWVLNQFHTYGIHFQKQMEEPGHCWRWSWCQCWGWWHVMQKDYWKVSQWGGVGGSSQRRYARSQTHTVSTLVSFLSPLFPYKASPWGRLTACFWIYPSCLDNKAQSIVLLLYLLSEYHENLRATLIRQQRGQGTSETREAGNGGKGGQEWARLGRSNRGQLSEDFKTWSSSSLRTQVSTTSNFQV